MNKIARKIGVAVIALVTIVSVSGITPAVAQTPAELQAQINALLANITALQAQLAVGAPAPAPRAVFNFTRNLTLGSTGEDVRALQQFLNVQGFAVAATGAGSAGNESTAFGPRTQAALARFQEANNISPARGFFGPVTRARIATLIPAPVVTPPVVTPPVAVIPPVVTPPVAEVPVVEGTLIARLLPSPLGVEVSVGEANRSVAAVELEARHSNIRVQRFDVLFDQTAADTATPATTDDRPWRTFNRVALSVGGEVVATRAITGRADFIEGTGTTAGMHILRFSGINANIPAGARQAWTVQVSASPVVEAVSRGTWAITVPEQGVRGIDGAGINQTAHTDAIGPRSFTVRAEERGNLAVTLNANNLAARVVQVDDVDMTNGVQLLAFDVRATRRAVTMEEVDVTLTAVGDTGLTGGADNNRADFVAPVARLYRGTTLVGSATVPITGLVEFNNMETLIERDSTATFTVRVDLNRLVANSTYPAGTTITARVTAVSGEGADQNPATVTAFTNITGNLAHLFTVTPSWTLVGIPTISQVSFGAGTRRDANAQIVVDITALGGDILIREGTTAGIEVLPTGTLTDGTIVLASNMTAASITATDPYGAHLIQEGTTRRFTITGSLSASTTPATSGFAGMRISEINWAISTTAPVWIESTFGLTALETGRVLISN